MARASPMAMAAAVDAVGARFSEQASSFTAMSRTMLLAWARVDFGLAVSASSGTARRFTVSRSSMSSAVSPLVEIASITSPAVSIPRSPWSASPVCRNRAGVPVLAKVAAIFRPTRPDLPRPVTTTRPLQACRSSTAFSKRVSRRSIRPAIASDSTRRTRLAVSRLIGVGRPIRALAWRVFGFFAAAGEVFREGERSRRRRELARDCRELRGTVRQCLQLCQRGLAAR